MSRRSPIKSLTRHSSDTRSDVDPASPFANWDGQKKRKIFCPKVYFVQLKFSGKQFKDFAETKTLRQGCSLKSRLRSQAFEMTNERREQYHWSELHLQLQFTVYIRGFCNQRTDGRNCSGLPSVQTPDVLIFWAQLILAPIWNVTRQNIFV